MSALLAVQGLWQLAGWTMLHYLWIGGLLGLAAFAVRRAARRLAPSVRYGIALAWFVALASVPLVIAVYLSRTDVITIAEETLRQPTRRTIAGPLPAGFARIGIVSAQPSPTHANQDNLGIPADSPRPLTDRIEQVLERVVGGLPWIWLVGTPLCVLVVASGLYGAERMRRGAMLVIEGPVANALKRSQDAIALGRAVAVAVSDRVVSPLVLGIVKPLILLPASAVAGWTPDQLQMILLHELAHVRRWDNLVNLLQRIVEAVFFYQPAVWLVSNWVRLEREHCCDTVVLAQGNEPQDYAETLASLAMPGISPRYAAAALASHQLVSRIRHILNVEDRSMKLSRRALLTLICGAALFSGLVAVYAHQQLDETARSDSEEPKLIQNDAPVAEDQTAKLSLDADRELTSLKMRGNRLAAARGQVQHLAQLYAEGTITLDFYVDALLREAIATQEYAEAFEVLFARLEQGGKIDPAYQRILKSLVVLVSAADSHEKSGSDSVTPQFAQKLDQVRTSAEIDTNTVQQADLKARRDKALRDEALTEWRHRKAELERLQSAAGAMKKKITDAGDSVSTDLYAAYGEARKTVDKANEDEAAAREKFYWLRGQIDAHYQSKQDWSAAQLTGPPDAESGREDRRAWSSATPDSQSEWIELVYEKPVEAVAVMISESYNPGAISSIKAFDAAGKWYWMLESRTASPSEKQNQVTMLPHSTQRPVAKLRITIESAAVPGYNQIDAVGLLDTKGQMHWAAAATASSDRSQPTSTGDGTYVLKAADQPYDVSFIKAIEVLTHGTHPYVLKNMNCQNCHQIQAASDAADPRRQALSRWIEAHAVDRPIEDSAAPATAKADAREKENQEREQRLAPLRKEIDEINQEIFKIKEELELQTQRETTRAELERLRKLLEDSRKARETGQAAQRP